MGSGNFDQATKLLAKRHGVFSPLRAGTEKHLANMRPVREAHGASERKHGAWTKPVKKSADGFSQHFPTISERQAEDGDGLPIESAPIQG